MCSSDAAEALDQVEPRPGLGLTPFAVDVHATSWHADAARARRLRGLVTDGWAIDERTYLEIRGDDVVVRGPGAPIASSRAGRRRALSVTAHPSPHLQAAAERALELSSSPADRDRESQSRGSRTTSRTDSHSWHRPQTPPHCAPQTHRRCRAPAQRRPRPAADRRVRGARNFPALAESRNRVLRAWARSAVMSEVVAAVESDVALVIAVLRLANQIDGRTRGQVDSIVRPSRCSRPRPSRPRRRRADLRLLRALRRLGGRARALPAARRRHPARRRAHRRRGRLRAPRPPA